MIDKEKNKNKPSKDESLEAPKQPANESWASDSQDELEDWIEEQGIQLRY